MSLDIKLVNENLISYTRTTDALRAFENSANSGQSRLALEVLVEVINGLVKEVERLNDLLDKPVSTAPKAEQDIEKAKPKSKPALDVKEANAEE